MYTRRRTQANEKVARQSNLLDFLERLTRVTSRPEPNGSRFDGAAVAATFEIVIKAFVMGH